MSQAIATDDYADRRQHKRHSVFRTAELMLRGSQDGIGCTVLDESAGGLQVELAKALDLPEEALIKFSDTASQLVRRCWAKGNRVGYQYIEIVPVERLWFPNVSVSPAQALPTEADVKAFNDFIQISWSLLKLSCESEELLYPAERIHALLSEMQDGWLLPEHGASGLRMAQFFAISRLIGGEPIEQNSFLRPSWIARP
jgi:hypothetical protein